MSDRDRPSEATACRNAAEETQRLDKWLWYARVAKTRSLAAALIERGRVRVNKVRTQKPSHTVRPGDVITASVHRDVRILEVVQAGRRRGPAAEAQELYADLTPVNEFRSSPTQRKASGKAPTSVGTSPNVTHTPSARPSKIQRRQLLRLKGQVVR